MTTALLPHTGGQAAEGLHTTATGGLGMADQLTTGTPDSAGSLVWILVWNALLSKLLLRVDEPTLYTILNVILSFLLLKIWKKMKYLTVFAV